MNMKYRYPLDLGTALVEIVKIQAKLPATQSDDSDD